MSMKFDDETPEMPTAHESEAKIATDAADAIAYLKRRGALDLIDTLGLTEHSSERV